MRWFRFVEVEVNSRCNRKCQYCPNFILPEPDVPKLMSDSVFERLLAELERIDYAGRLSYHLFSEPLLRRDLERLVKSAAAALPKAKQILYTNGDFLTDDRYRSLIDAGIHHLIVTSHSGRRIPEREHQTVQYPGDLVLANRGGLLFEKRETLSLPCHAPADRLVVTVTGDVLLCCDDARRTEVMGNITRQPLEEIWFSERFARVRHLLQRGERDRASPICRHCDNREYSNPGADYHQPP